MKKVIFLTIFILVVSLNFIFGQGSTYCGPYTVAAPVVLVGIKNQTIKGLKITNPSGHCISLTNCSNITIQNCKLGPSKKEGVYIYNCTNITVNNCSMSNIETGVYAAKSTGIKVTNNDVLNVQGPFPKGQMVQFDKISDGGNRINYNVCENLTGQSTPEDVISLYMSNGTETDPIQIIGNWIRGGGPSTSGGGIMTGDNGGSYVLVQNNILVNPGQYGIAISSGNHISIKNNKVYSAKLVFTNVGLYAYNQYPSDCSSDTIMNNTLNFTHKGGTLNNTWTNGSCGDVFGWKTNYYDPRLNSSILPVKLIGRCQNDSIRGTKP
jgi:parallel beta-helix repeat protein